MRKTVTLETYKKIKHYMLANKNKAFLQSELRDLLNVDYESLKLVIGQLVSEKVVCREDSKIKVIA